MTPPAERPGAPGRRRFTGAAGPDRPGFAGAGPDRRAFTGAAGADHRTFGGDTGADRRAYGSDADPVFGGDTDPVFGGDTDPVFGGDGDPEQPRFDGEAGPVVRPFTVTRGRARPAPGFDLLAFVESVADAGAVANLQPECRAILLRARRPVSVAELASHVDLPLGVVRVLLGDMVHSGLIVMHESGAASHRPDERVLKAVINGLRSL